MAKLIRPILALAFFAALGLAVLGQSMARNQKPTPYTWEGN